MRFLRNHNKQANLWMWLTVCCGLFASVFFIIQAYCLASIVEKIYITKEPFASALSLIWIIVACIILRALVVYFKEKFSFKSANMAKTSLRKLCFNHILQQGPIINQHYHAGELSAMMVEQIEATHDFYANYLPQVMLVVFIPIIILIAIFPLNWVAGCLLLITAPLIPLFMALVGLGAKAANERNFKALARLSNHFLDLIQGMAILKNHGQIHNQSSNLQQSITALRKKSMEVLRIAFLSSAVLEFFSSLSIAMLATYLGLSFLGHLNVGYYNHLPTLKVALFILLLAPEFYLPLRQLGGFYHAKQQALTVSENLQRILLIKNNEIIKNDMQDVNQVFCETIIKSRFSTLQFHQVTMRYPTNDYDSLDNIDLKINAGEHVAILGSSGAGKSTLLNLLLGFIKPSDGYITINETNLSEIKLADWQAKISWLGQNPQLLFGTLASNLRLANPLATDNQLLEVCRLTQLDDVILSSGQGLALPIGENNAGLSGGQAQRLALARMYLKPCSLFVLDEPTANLDEENSRLLHQVLQKMMQQKTTIISTHKKETAQLAQRVILLDQGKIIADGKFDEVILHPLLSHWQEQ